MFASFYRPHKKNKSKAETFFSESQTVPDQSMSMKDMLARFVRGLPLPRAKTPIYDGDVDMPDFSQMDLVDVQEMLEKHKAQLTEIRSKRDKKAKNAAESKLREKLTAEIKAELEALNKNTAPVTP